jgi:ribonuclease P protein component
VARGGTARLRRTERLRDSRDYQRIGREGVRRASSHFVVVVGEDREGVVSMGPVLGITVSKKVGTAVERNRVKRRIREWFRQNRAGLSRRVVIVVIARRGAAGIGAAETAQELGALLL